MKLSLRVQRSNPGQTPKPWHGLLRHFIRRNDGPPSLGDAVIASQRVRLRRPDDRLREQSSADAEAVHGLLRRSAPRNDGKGGSFNSLVTLEHLPDPIKLGKAFAFVSLLWLSPLPAAAVQPDEILSDPKLEARARALSAELRCMVCQNESIDDSSADLARDLRLLVRERLKAGDSDAQIRSFLTTRYGDFILLKPPFKPETWLLWMAPLLVLLTGSGLIFLARRRQSRQASEVSAASLSEDERSRLEALVGKEEGQ